MKKYNLGASVLGHGGGHHGGHHGGGGRGFRGGWGGGYGYGWPYYDVDDYVDVIDVPTVNVVDVDEMQPTGTDSGLRGYGVRDGRGYGPYGMGYYDDGEKVLPIGPKGEHLPSSDYDFTPGPNGFLKGKGAPKKTVQGATVLMGQGPRRKRISLDGRFIHQEILGGYNIATWQNQMNELKQIPLIMAQVLVARGQQAINYAKSVASVMDLAQSATAGPFAQKTPGATRRDEVAGKLQWHADNLAKLAPSAWGVYQQFQSDPDAFKKMNAALTAMYPSGDDLKKWVMQAFIEANAVEEGASILVTAWETMWREIGAAIAALPAEVVEKVKAGLDSAKIAFYVGISAVGLVGVGALVYLLKRHPSVLPGPK